MTVLGCFVLNWRSLITFLVPSVYFLVFEIQLWTQQIQSAQHSSFKEPPQPCSTSQDPHKRSIPTLKILHYVFLGILCWEIRAPYQTLMIILVHVFLHILKVELLGFGHGYAYVQPSKF